MNEPNYLQGSIDEQGELFRPKPSNSLISISSLLLVVSVILYATGFVVVSTALERLGVAMPAGDFLKIQYVYVGVIVGFFVAFCVGTSFLVFHFIETKFPSCVDRSKEIPKRSVSAMCLVALGLYFQVAFALPGSFAIISASVLVGFIVFWLVFAHLPQQIKSNPKIRGPLLWALLSIAVIFFCIECGTVLGVKWPEPSWNPRINLAIMASLTILQAIFVGRLIFRVVKQEQATQFDFRERLQWYFLNASTVVMLYYSTIVGFAVVCFTHMPVRKGGADFRVAPDAVFHFKAPRPIPAQNALVDPSDPTGLTSIPVVMLAETSFSFYAGEDPCRQRERWGKIGDTRPPHVWEISRDSVTGIDSSNKWPRPAVEDLKYKFPTDTPCMLRPGELPGQPAQIIAKGTRGAIIRREPGWMLVWIADGTIRTWVPAE